LRESKRATRAYRLLGYERFPLSKQLLEQLVRDELIAPDTKVLQDGECFATAIRSRAEFRHLFVADAPPPEAARADERRTTQKSPRRHTPVG